jgi:hypothetical protein
VRVERDDGGRAARLDCLAHDRLVTEVDAVERPDRDRAGLRLELGRDPRDFHAFLVVAGAGGSTREPAVLESNASTWARRPYVPFERPPPAAG